MRKLKKWIIPMLFIVIELSIGLCPISANASKTSREEYGPLIQSTDDNVLRDGIISLGLLEILPLQIENEKNAIKLVEPTAVRIRIGGYLGSGSIFKISKESMTILASRHLLMCDSVGEITFINEVKVDGRVTFLSNEYDMGFMEIPMEQLPLSLLEQVKQVSYPIKEMRTITYGTEIFLLGSLDGVAKNITSGSVLEPNQYFEEFQQSLIHCYGEAQPGMSGCGLFDFYGNFYGILVGGLKQETACLSIDHIEEEFLKYENNG